MKKTSIILLVIVLSLSLFTGCSSDSGEDSAEELTVIKIGATPDPHFKILELIKDDLKEDGIDLDIKEFTDYVTPNVALEQEDLDANFFQHEPYLKDMVDEEGYDLVSIGNVHVEPMALYSESLNSLDEIEDGAEIAIPSDNVNGARALILLEANGLIEVDKDAGLNATERDITSNPKNLKFSALQAEIIPQALQDVDAAVINGNYAIDAGLNPVEDGLIIEGEESPYANIIAVRSEDAEDEKFKTLLKHLQSDKVKKFIEDNYDGGVVPAF